MSANLHTIIATFQTMEAEMLGRADEKGYFCSENSKT